MRFRGVGAFAVGALALAAAALGAGPAAAAGTKIRLAVGGATCLCYLPAVLAKQLGFYEQVGLDVEMTDFKGGSQALTAVLGGSADVVSGYFDHTVQLAAKGKSMQAIVVQGNLPGEVLVVSPKSANDVKSIADLVGKQVGVSAPGSSTDFFIKYLLAKNGIDPGKVGVVGIGLGASSVAAMEQGQVQAAVMLDPAVTQLQARHKDLKILVDTRDEAKTKAVFGGDYPGGVLYAPTAWLEGHQDEATKLAAAILKTLDYVHSHKADEVAAKMPAEFLAGDAKIYAEALAASVPTYSKTGLMDPKGAAAVLDVFSQFVPEVKSANVDVTRTYTDAYVKKARATLAK